MSVFPTGDMVRDRLIIALDVPTVEQAREIVSSLGDRGTFYKIGYHLLFGDGIDLVRELKAQGKGVFLDAKLLDIDNTVEKGIAAIADLGVDMVTVHAYPGAMEAAVRGASNTQLCLLAVTVLTSMDDNDLTDAGYSVIAAALVEKRAAQARDAGMGGIVCAAREAQAVRRLVGEQMAVVTPGIRLSPEDSQDQKRVHGPAEAIGAGASHIVAGRPVVKAEDPVATAERIAEEIEEALAARD